LTWAAKASYESLGDIGRVLLHPPQEREGGLEGRVGATLTPDDG
jgi:hypothetical protein